MTKDFLWWVAAVLSFALMIFSILAVVVTASGFNITFSGHVNWVEVFWAVVFTTTTFFLFRKVERLDLRKKK